MRYLNAGRYRRVSDSSSSDSSWSSTTHLIPPQPAAPTNSQSQITTHRIALLANLSTQHRSLAALISSRQKNLKSNTQNAAAAAELVILRRRLAVVEGKIEGVGKELVGGLASRKRAARGKERKGNGGSDAGVGVGVGGGWVAGGEGGGIGVAF